MSEFAIECGVPLEIRQLANGYIVFPASYENCRSVLSDKDRLVFQSYAELSAWLARHFTYRSGFLAIDE